MSIQDDFLILRDHFINIRRHFNIYNNLFFSGHDEILANTALTFFNDISEIMLRDWILQVCKIMDPPEKKIGKETCENITIQLINNHLKKMRQMTPRIEELSKSILSYGKKLIPARNKRLAHFDKASQLQNGVLGATTEEELEQFLLSMQKYSDEVGKTIGVGPLDFSGNSCVGDELDLLEALKYYCNNFKGIDDNESGSVMRIVGKN